MSAIPLVARLGRTMQGHVKLMLQIAFGLLSVGLGIYFIRHEQAELSKVKLALVDAEFLWVLAGLLLVLAFVVVQGIMYQVSFAALHQRIKLSTGIALYLKRNLVSVFLPAGVLTNMFFFNEEVEKKEGVTKTQIYFASSIFSAASILTGIIVGLPALLWLVIRGSLKGQYTIGIVLTAILLISVGWAITSLIRKGTVYDFLSRKLPEFRHMLDEASSQAFDIRKVWLVVGFSLIIEIIGISHLFIAIGALGGNPTLEIAIIGYAIVLLLLMSSPFLRGIGAIEVALTYVLTIFGFTNVLALSVAFLFRFFEFWSILVLGCVAMVAQRDNLLLRITPAFLLFLLGIVNILSAITPAVPARLATLNSVLPLAAIHASTWLVLLSGIILLGLSVYLLKGLRNAWIGAVCLSSISLVAHITKGIDWEEAVFSLITLLTLLYQHRQYFIKPDLNLARRSLWPVSITAGAVLVLCTLGFYFLDQRHFSVDFTLWESVREAFSSFFLINIDLVPSSRFGKEFLLSVNLLGACTLGWLAYALLRPLIKRQTSTVENERQVALDLVQKYGRGSLDYFKSYDDKKFWFNHNRNAFISFKTSRNYAMVLENPIAPDKDSLAIVVKEFDLYCRSHGLRSAYYRIPEMDKELYERLGKKLLPIGEEAVVNLDTWTLDGGDKKGMRNSLNKLTKQGYLFKVNPAPQTDAFMQQLKAVSNGWLADMKRHELVFSQGTFNEKELKDQTILSLQTSEGKVEGFVNLIPDYTPGEANFDLMRKTAEAPNGTMDFIFVKMFEYLKNRGFRACNMGMVPMSGIEDPENLQERVIKLGYERIRQFGHYKSLHDFKDKFQPKWQMMYLAYSALYDLIYLPGALEQVVET